MRAILAMEGAGGAGPGYDGTGSGRGKEGMVPNSTPGQPGNEQTNNSIPNPNPRREKPPQH